MKSLIEACHIIQIICSSSNKTFLESVGTSIYSYSIKISHIPLTQPKKPKLLKNEFLFLVPTLSKNSHLGLVRFSKKEILMFFPIT